MLLALVSGSDLLGSSLAWFPKWRRLHTRCFCTLARTRATSVHARHVYISSLYVLWKQWQSSCPHLLVGWTQRCRAAKNVILAGVKSVKLYDPSPVEVKDLGTQFYLSESDVGQPTAAACKAKLQELNTAVQVSVLDSICDADMLPVQVRGRSSLWMNHGVVREMHDLTIVHLWTPAAAVGFICAQRARVLGPS